MDDVDGNPSDQVIEERLIYTLSREYIDTLGMSCLRSIFYLSILVICQFNEDC